MNCYYLLNFFSFDWIIFHCLIKLPYNHDIIGYFIFLNAMDIGRPMPSVILLYINRLFIMNKPMNNSLKCCHSEHNFFQYCIDLPRIFWHNSTRVLYLALVEPYMAYCNIVWAAPRKTGQLEHFLEFKKNIVVSSPSHIFTLSGTFKTTVSKVVHLEYI